MTYDKARSHKKTGLNPLSRRYTFETTTGEGVKLIPQPFKG